MPDILHAKHCSPTLAGIKTGNLFAAVFANEEERVREIRRLNRLLNPAGLRAVLFCGRRNRTLIYLYRPAFLVRDLRDPEAQELLRERGYRVENAAACLNRLAVRIAEEGEFPHEIGLFLGYPPGDVRAFIERGAKAPLITGVWKVYHDPEKAERIFEQYRQCTDIFCRKMEMGVPLRRLIVRTGRTEMIQYKKGKVSA